MSNELNGDFSVDSFAKNLCRYTGETVTIFTKSGGQSGSGFTGVVLTVNDCFVRLITRIGPAPGCALGNACSNNNFDNSYGNCGTGCGKGPGGGDGYPVYSVGAVTDIPIDSIASFVHNAV